MYPLISQKNSKWQNFLIPGSDLSVSKYGCVLCCVCMLLNYLGKKEDPLTLSPKVKFDKGNFVWASISVPYPKLKFLKRDEPVNVEDLKKHLAGMPVIVKINADQSGSIKNFKQHWIILWLQISDDDYLISDPLKERLTNFRSLYTADPKFYAAVFYFLDQKLTEPEKLYLETENELLRSQIKKFKSQIEQIKDIVFKM